MIKKIYKEHKEIVNYLIVGVLTTVVSLGTYYLCVFTFFEPKIALQLQLANIISWIVAVLFAFFANRRYVFESKSPYVIKEATMFFGSRIGTLLLDMGIMFVTVTVCGFNDKIAKLIVQIVVTIGNYFLSKFVVFNKSKPN